MSLAFVAMLMSATCAVFESPAVMCHTEFSSRRLLAMIAWVRGGTDRRAAAGPALPRRALGSGGLRRASTLLCDAFSNDARIMTGWKRVETVCQRSASRRAERRVALVTMA